MSFIKAMTGSVSDDQPSPLKLEQAILLPELTHDSTRPTLLMVRDSSARVFPAKAASYLSTTFRITE